MSRVDTKFVVLMAEDDEDDRVLVRDALEGQPVEVRFVEDGEELMDYLHCRGKYGGSPAALRPDLILLDLNMPRKDGRQALVEIRADPQLKTIPIVVLTTTEEECEINNCYAMGANTFIVKPVSFEQLAEALNILRIYWSGISRLPTKVLPKSCTDEPSTGA